MAASVASVPRRWSREFAEPAPRLRNGLPLQGRAPWRSMRLISVQYIALLFLDWFSVRRLCGTIGKGEDGTQGCAARPVGTARCRGHAIADTVQAGNRFIL